MRLCDFATAVGAPDVFMRTPLATLLLGSRVEYGPEGETGPNEVAYLRIEGQGCLYNIWSNLGRDHLEELIRELRFVR